MEISRESKKIQPIHFNGIAKKELFKKRFPFKIVFWGFLMFLFLGFAVYVSFSIFGDGEPQKETAFLEAYDRYLVLSKEQENTTYLPGAENNPVRRNLNFVLNSVLVGDTSEVRRVELAHQGLGLIDELELQIDAIGMEIEGLNLVIDELCYVSENTSKKSEKEMMDELTSLARKKIEISADIRGLAYTANYKAEKILKRVANEGGVLSDDFKVFLNNQIPEAERQFDMRFNLYNEMEKINEKMSEKFALLEESIMY